MLLQKGGNMNIGNKIKKGVATAALLGALVLPVGNSYAVGTSTSENVPDNRIEQAYEKIQPGSITDLVVLDGGYVTERGNALELRTYSQEEEENYNSSKEEVLDKIDYEGNKIITNENMNQYRKERKEENLENRLRKAEEMKGEEFADNAALYELPGGYVTTGELAEYIVKAAGVEAGYRKADKEGNWGPTTQFKKDRHRGTAMETLENHIEKVCNEADQTGNGIITGYELGQYLKPEKKEASYKK